MLSTTSLLAASGSQATMRSRAMVALGDGGSGKTSERQQRKAEGQPQHRAEAQDAPDRVRAVRRGTATALEEAQRSGGRDRWRQ